MNLAVYYITENGTRNSALNIYNEKRIKITNKVPSEHMIIKVISNAYQLLQIYKCLTLDIIQLSFKMISKCRNDRLGKII